MYVVYEVSKVLSIAAFLFYGFGCLFSDGMVAEFERFGLSRFRRLTGALEILGALGLLAGYVIDPLVPLAAGGLALLMLLGVLTRFRVRDSLLATSPAILLLAVNVFVLLYSIESIGAAASN